LTSSRSYSVTDLRKLTEACISLTSELSLDAVLQKLVDVAREQVNARYGALSVLNEEGGIAQFLTSGIPEEERARIGDLPRGHGLLGVILREGTSLRLDDISADPRSAGFPPNHPHMKSLLGVPVVLEGRVIGNLYLTDKISARGFSAEDEEIVRLLATQAAIAVRNAELYEAERRRAEEWKTLFELGREVKASPDLKEILTSIVQRARRLLKADLAILMLLTDDSTLEVAAHDGLRTQAMQKLRLLSEHGLQDLVLKTGGPVIVADYQSDRRLKNKPAKLVAEEGIVSAVSVPLAGKSRLLGTLTVGNRTRTTFTERHAELLEAFANWTVVAIETSQLYDQLQSLALLEERERIGMDLHDGVIQSIYAIGLQLEDCTHRIGSSPQSVKQDLSRAIDSLNRVIRDIRSYIFDLRPRVSEVSDLREAIRQLAEELRVNTLIDVQVETSDRLDGLTQEQALAIFHVAQEALNNVGKHSKATSARVRLYSPHEGTVAVEVSDNGIGFDPETVDSLQRQGLRNIRDRARSLGGEATFISGPGRGTTVRMQIRTGGKDADAER
jgi:signal transduction histidine kinase